MSIDCENWSDSGRRDGGKCALNLFGGHPSYGTCQHACEKRQAIPGFVQVSIPHPSQNGPIARLCRWAATYDGDTAAGAKWLDDYAATLDKRPQEQFAAYRSAHAPPLHRRRAVQLWVHSFINAVPNKNRGVAPLSLAEAEKLWGWKSEPIIPDRIVCLSLEHRNDRWDTFTRSCGQSKYLSQWKIERYRARPPAEMIIPDYWANSPASHYATRVDHLRMIEQSYVAGHETILIFEDDAIVQAGFDEAMESACAELPRDWMGLWLTSDGHQSAPQQFSANLVRSRSQLFLHAYMLSRRGMHRFFSHVLANPGMIIDAGTAELMTREPHFYATRNNAVIQIGQRCFGDRPREDYFNRDPVNVIIPPYHGEFGHQILWHVRYVHELQADSKIVCCRRGDELLYPSATGFEYGWQESGDDASRFGHGPDGVSPARRGHRAVKPEYKDFEPWKKFTPQARHSLPTVDVVLGARSRADTSRNWPHWQWLADQLRNEGLTVGVAGRADVTDQLIVDVKSWDHPDGHTAGSVDLLTHCRLYVGTDSGITHLAALCDTPTSGFRREGSGPDFMRFSQQLNRSRFDRLPKTAWEDREAVLHELVARVLPALIQNVA